MKFLKFKLKTILFADNFKRKSVGFTLIELLLYIAIASFILLSISVAISFMFRSRIKSQAITEVFDQGNYALEMITQKTRNSIKINTPATSTSATSLSIVMATSSINPTIFDLSGGVIRIKEGASSSISLTSPRVVASNIIFDNLSRDLTPGIIRVQFTLSHANPTGRSEYNFTKTFYGSAIIKY